MTTVFAARLIQIFSRNSRTSRPRSPINAMTFTSDSARLAIMPSKVDLPTPLPAKMPRRCPRPRGERINRLHAGLKNLFDALPLERMRREKIGADLSFRCQRTKIVSGWPRLSMTRPMRPLPTGTFSGEPSAMTSLPG